MIRHSSSPVASAPKKEEREGPVKPGLRIALYIYFVLCSVKNALLCGGVMCARNGDRGGDDCGVEGGSCIFRYDTNTPYDGAIAHVEVKNGACEEAVSALPVR